MEAFATQQPVSLDMHSDKLSSMHHFAESIVSSTALVFNIVLLYLILRYSQFKEKSYKYILLMSCVADIWLVVVVFIGQPVGTPSHACRLRKHSFRWSSPVEGG